MIESIRPLRRLQPWATFAATTRDNLRSPGLPALGQLVPSLAEQTGANSSLRQLPPKPMPAAEFFGRKRAGWSAPSVPRAEQMTLRAKADAGPTHHNHDDDND